MDFKTNYQFYPNYQLNTIANEIATELDELDECAAVVMGQSTQVDLARAQQLVSRMKGDPTSFSMGLFRRNLPKLNKIGSQVGSQDEAFIQLGDKLRLLICEILKSKIFTAYAMTEAPGLKGFLKDPDAIEMRAYLGQCITVLDELSQLKTSPYVNMEVTSLKNKVVELERKFTPSAGGCYIATYVYGDYNSPEVLTLRLFRDNYLSHYAIGIYFIKKYYSISPKLIEKYSENMFFKRTAKVLVSCLVKLVK
jgi:hypothetical protein